MKRIAFIALGLAFVMFNCEKENDVVTENQGDANPTEENYRTGGGTYVDHLITNETASSMLDHYMNTYESEAQISWYSIQDLKDYISYVESANVGADPNVLGIAFYYSRYDETTAPRAEQVDHNTIFMSPANYVDEHEVDAAFTGSATVSGSSMNMSGCCNE